MKLILFKKNTILFFAAILFLNFTFAQTFSKEEVEVVQNLFGSEKKVIIENNIDLSGVDSDKFWKLYNEYEDERKKVAEEKLDLLYKYTTKKGAISEIQAENLLNKAIPLRAAEDNLILKFTKRMKRETSALVAAQFYQIEHYISDGIRFNVLDNINFIQDK